MKALPTNSIVELKLFEIHQVTSPKIFFQNTQILQRFTMKIKTEIIYKMY
jgi:hypothetical protein